MSKVAFAEERAADFALRAELYEKLGIRHPSARHYFFEERDRSIKIAEFWSQQAEHYSRPGGRVCVRNEA